MVNLPKTRHPGHSKPIKRHFPAAATCAERHLVDAVRVLGRRNCCSSKPSSLACFLWSSWWFKSGHCPPALCQETGVIKGRRKSQLAPEDTLHTRCLLWTDYKLSQHFPCTPGFQPGLPSPEGKGTTRRQQQGVSHTMDCIIPLLSFRKQMNSLSSPIPCCSPEEFQLVQKKR